MNKAELVSRVASDCGITKAKALQAVDCVVDSIQTTLGGGGRIAIAGLGTFGTSNRAARMGRNPQTGQSINIPARRAPTFKAAKALKNAAS
jgi:DNA-binding protein HU-beta